MWLPGPVHRVSKKGGHFPYKVAFLLENDPKKTVTTVAGHRNQETTKKSDRIVLIQSGKCFDNV